MAKDTDGTITDCDVLGLQRIGSHIGMVSDPSTRHKNLGSTLVSPRDLPLPRLHKLVAVGDTQDYDRDAKGLAATSEPY